MEFGLNEGSRCVAGKHAIKPPPCSESPAACRRAFFRTEVGLKFSLDAFGVAPTGARDSKCVLVLTAGLGDWLS